MNSIDKCDYDGGDCCSNPNPVGDGVCNDNYDGGGCCFNVGRSHKCMIPHNIKLPYLESHAGLGAIFILRNDIGMGGWSRKWTFSLTLCSENVLT